MERLMGKIVKNAHFFGKLTKRFAGLQLQDKNFYKKVFIGQKYLI